MKSIWLQILTAESQEHLSQEDWQALKNIAEDIYFFAWESKTETIPYRTSRLLKILGYDSWKSFNILRDNLQKDISLIAAVQKKLLKYSKQRMTINLFFECGKNIDCHKLLGKKGIKFIEDDYIITTQYHKKPLKGGTLHNEYYDALERLNTNHSYIKQCTDAFYADEYMAVEYETFEKYIEAKILWQRSEGRVRFGKVPVLPPKKLSPKKQVIL